MDARHGNGVLWAVSGSHPARANLVPVGSKLAVLGFAPNGSRQGNLVVLTMPRVSAPTSVTIEANCVTVGCARGLVLLGIDPREPHTGLEGSCTLTTGTVQITSAEGGRIRGTFTAAGRCSRSGGASPDQDLTVREGQFDVQVEEGLRTGLEIWS